MISNDFNSFFIFFDQITVVWGFRIGRSHILLAPTPPKPNQFIILVVIFYGSQGGWRPCLIQEHKDHLSDCKAVCYQLKPALSQIPSIPKLGFLDRRVS